MKSHQDKELHAKDLKTQALLGDLLAVLHLWKGFCHEDSKYIWYTGRIYETYVYIEEKMFEEEDAWEYESFNWVGKVDSDDIRGSKGKKKKTANWFQISGHGLHWLFLAINNYVKLSHGLRRMFHTGLQKNSSKSAIFTQNRDLLQQLSLMRMSESRFSALLTRGRWRGSKRRTSSRLHRLPSTEYNSQSGRRAALPMLPVNWASSKVSFAFQDDQWRSNLCCLLCLNQTIVHQI